MLEVTPANISVLACKRSEDGESVIVRLQETQGRETEASVALPSIGCSWTSVIGAWEIRTFAVLVRDRTVREVDLLERDIVGMADAREEAQLRGDLTATVP